MANKLKYVKFKDILSIFLMCVAFLPAMIAKIFIRDFWLVCEVKNEARDNGYCFFKYVREKYPKQKIAYAINKKCEDYDKVKSLGKVISYGGLSHWFWYFVADKNISSQKSGKPNAAVCYLLEVVLGLRKKNRYFLQHGITINNVEFLHHKNTKMFRFAVSTKQEKEFIDSYFGYPQGAVCLTGMCRFDGLVDNEVNKKQILVMPSWRQWIAKGVETEKIEGSKIFEETNYFKHWQSFLKSKKLEEILEKYDKELIFYPHRDMQKYINKFVTNSKRIKIANCKDYDVQSLLRNSAMLVTDYSSVFFDFAYMRKPIVFYQFDEEQFRKHQYTKGYFDYKESELGQWSNKEHEMIDMIEKSIKNEFASNSEGIDKYFPNRDSKNCERNYQMVKYGKVLEEIE